MLATGCQPKVGEQDKDEPAGNFPVRVLSAKFPLKQHLAKNSSMEIAVQNAGDKRIPDINVTVKCPGTGLGGSFDYVSSQPGNSDPRRPQFVVNQIPTRMPRRAPELDPAPLERSSALVDTYPLGPLEPGGKVTFRWDVTAVKGGPFKLCWQVNAGLYGKSKAVRASGSPPITGRFAGTVSTRAPKATIAADGHTVIEK